MGKGKQKFNKKQAVRFTLVPGFDENGKPITHFRPVETKKSKVSQSQRQKIIMQISDQAYDQIEIDGKLVGQNQIPAFVLQQIKGRKDLIFNQKGMNQKFQKQQAQGDLYQVMDEKDYDGFQDFDEEDEKQWIDDQDIIDEEDLEEEQYQDWEDEEEFTDQEQIMDEDQPEIRDKKDFKLDQNEFPILTKVNVQGIQCELTPAQIKLLDVLIPQNYENFKIDGLQFEKYDQNGLPLSQKAKYQEFLADGTEGVVDSFDYVPDAPTPIYDTDLKPSQIKGDIKEIQDALNFDGQQGVYQELEDDFFSNMIKAEIEANKKNKKDKKTKSKKTESKSIKPIPKQINQAKLPKELENFAFKNQENVFAKYDELDEDILEQQITDDMIEKALDDFEHNLEPKQTVKLNNNKNIDLEDEQQMQETMSRNNTSMNFSELEKCPQLIGKDGELDWRCLTKKEKKEYMKTKIIRSFYEEIRERQIQEKLKGKKNVTAEQLHLKSLVDKLPLQEDHVMRKALEQHAKEEVDLDQEQSYESQSDEEDIIEYRQRTSVISSNLNEINQTSTKKKKKQRDNEDKSEQLEQLSQTLSKLKTASEKRDRNQTAEERKARKEKQKQLKKQKKQIKKEFAEKFAQERRKHIKMTKPSDPLHKVSFVKII